MNAMQGKPSLYRRLGVIIFGSVFFVLFLQSAYHYTVTKEKLVHEMHSSAESSIDALRQNVTGLIEAYAVNEYESLIRTEMEHRRTFAIVIRDYRMGEVLGDEAYVGGNIRFNGKIVDYDPKKAAHNRLLKQCYYAKSYEIEAPSGELLGTITIYISDEAMQEELRQIVKDMLSNALFISIVLVVWLFFAIRRFILGPIDAIVKVIAKSDKDGMPPTEIPDSRYKEIASLTSAMNSMIATAKDSRSELHKALRTNRLIIETIPDLIWLKDINGIYLLCNSRFERFFGAEEAQIVGKTDYDFVDKELADFFRENDKKAMHAGKPSVNEEWVTFATDGKRLLLETTKVPLVYDDGSVIGILGVGHDITERVRHQEELEHSAKHDSLTGLPNRFLFNELIANAIARSKRSDRLLALLYLDLDGFKEINDSYGHQAGDAVLVEIADRMRGILRQEDIVARLGGDEFVIAISDIKEKEDIVILVDRLILDLGAPIPCREREGLELEVTSSIGITFADGNGTTSPDTLLREADKAMYAAKNAGKNRYRYYSPAID